MRRVTLRGLFAHRGRLVMSVLAVALSVAFLTGTLMVTDTVTDALDRMTAATAADVTVTARPPADEDPDDSDTVPAGTVAKVRAVPGVADARGVIRSPRVVVLDGHDATVGATSDPSFLGLNWLPTGRHPVRLTAGHEPRGPGEAVIDAGAAAASRVRLGDPLRVVTAGGSFPVTVAGVAALPGVTPDATLIFFDTGTAQARLLGSRDVFTAVEIDAAAGVSHPVLEQRVEAALGAGFRAQTRAEAAKAAADELGELVAFLGGVMVAFAGVALLVSTFLIFNTFSMLVAARTREVGLLRALGADRRQVGRSVLVEALMLGVVGATFGLLAGSGLALGLMAAVDGLGSGASAMSLVLRPHTPVTAYGLGVLVTLWSAYLPARRAARIAPVAALRVAGAPSAGTSRRRTAIGALLLAVGAIASAVAAGAGSGVALTVAVVTGLLAFVVSGPVLARLLIPAVTAAYPRLFGAVGRLSRSNTLRNPRRTGATAAALMIGIAVVGAVAVLASSMDTSVQRRIDATLGADYVVSTTAMEDPPLAPEVAGVVRRVPGVARVTRTKVADVAVSAGGHTEHTWMLGIEPDAGAMAPVRYERGAAADALAPGRIAVGSDYAKEHGVTIGSVVTLTTSAGRTAQLTVGAILAEDRNPAQGRRKEKVGDTSRHGSRPTVGVGTLDRLAPGTPDDTLRVSLEKGAEPRVVAEEIRHAVARYPQLRVRGPAEYKALAGEQINGLLLLVYGLLALTIVIAVLGVVNTLALSVVERIRELGLLRAVGATRAQVRRLVRLESTAIAGYGATLGLVLGLSWGVAAQRVLAAEGVDTLTVPWTTILAVVLGSVVVGRLAAVLPARRAARLDVLRAVAAD
ncbi:FtsX-like permease family protein [Actinoplanes sp. NPDC049548]|uniref:ABC transporter permease n=1 Tax=Actinoplanes sp. NPDC049548 TaxID=3155152 RepID=UPI003440F85B